LAGARSLDDVDRLSAGLETEGKAAGTVRNIANPLPRMLAVKRVHRESGGEGGPSAGSFGVQSVGAAGT
jgi:hypothetical protein